MHAQTLRSLGSGNDETYLQGLKTRFMATSSLSSIYQCRNITEISMFDVFLLNFRHRASCIQGQAFRYSPAKAFYIFNQQIYFII